MDADLAALREVPRFKKAVECLFEPLLKQRDIAPMPCKHGRTFEDARQARREFFEEIGEEDPADDCDSMQQPEGYCDCGPFNRRNELWEIAEMCVKRNLTREQMSDIAALIAVLTTTHFTSNHFHRAMLDLFCGEHKDFLRAVERQRKKGASFDVAVHGLVARWQWRMMPNA